LGDDIFNGWLSIRPHKQESFYKETIVGNLQRAIDTLLNLLTQFGLTVAAVLTELEFWLRGQLQQLGVPHAVQTLVLLAVAAVLVLGSLRLFGGLIRIAVVLILLLIAIHIVMPIIQD
jgi:hypothetical protein